MPLNIDPRELSSLQKGRPAFRGPGSRAKNDALASKGKDVVDQITKIRLCTQTNYKSTKTWRDAGAESYEFVENKQWKQADVEFLASPEGGRRPAMTFNKVLPQVRLLSGMERQNREELRVFPREGSDTQDSDVMTGLIKYCLDENLAPWQLTRKSNDVYICGRGWVKTDISYDENVNGDCTIQRRNPFQIFWDTMSDDWSGADMRWVQDSPWMTEDEARELWPEFAEMIKVGDWLSGSTPFLVSGVQSGDVQWENKLFLDAETRRVRCLEHWYKVRQPIMLAVNVSTGDVRNAEDESFLEQLQGMDEAQRSAFQIVRQNKTVIRVATVMNWIIVQDKPSPFKHNMLPLIPYIGLQFMGEPYGLVEYLKDPQRLGNKSISQVQGHLNRSANSGWLNKAQGGANSEQLQKFGSIPGIVIDYEDIPPTKIMPTPLDTGHMSLAQTADGLIREISLLNAELSGLGTQKTVSGRAIEARQRGGMTGNEDFFDNMLLGDKILGYQLISNIQQAYTQSRIIRILGAQSVRNPDDTGAKMFLQLKNNPDDLFKIVDRCLKAEYDYVVDRSPQSVTVRMAQFETLMKAAKDFPGAVPPDVLVDMSDFPENVKSRIKQHLQKMQQMEDMKAQLGGGGMPQIPQGAMQ